MSDQTGRWLLEGEVKVYAEADADDLKLRREVGFQRVRLFTSLAVSRTVESMWRINSKIEQEDATEPFTIITYRANNVIKDVTLAEAAEIAGEVDAFLQEVWIHFDQDLFTGGGMRGTTVEPDQATREKLGLTEPKKTKKGKK